MSLIVKGAACTRALLVQLSSDGVSDGTLPVALGRVSELAACTDCQFSAGEAGESTLQSQGGAMRRD